MERSNLKNIVILTLALVNLFLLGSLFLRHSEEQSARARTAEELTSLFAADGVSLDPDSISDDVPPAKKTLNRDPSAEQALAAFVLGKQVTVSDEGGGLYTYTSSQGQGFFHPGGSFDITGRLAGDGVDAFCRDFCKIYGYGNLEISSDASHSLTAVQYYNGYPVMNATVTFLVEDGCLISVSGTYLSGRELSSESNSMTAATALSQFLRFRREDGAVVSAVKDVYLCYQLQSTPVASMALSPAWCIVTDTICYYVNCSDGTVSHA